MNRSVLTRWLLAVVSLSAVGFSVFLSLSPRTPELPARAVRTNCSFVTQRMPIVYIGTPAVNVDLTNGDRCDICVLSLDGPQPLAHCMGIAGQQPNEVASTTLRVTRDASGDLSFVTLDAATPGWHQVFIAGQWHAVEVQYPEGDSGGGFCRNGIPSNPVVLSSPISGEISPPRPTSPGVAVPSAPCPQTADADACLGSSSGPPRTGAQFYPADPARGAQNLSVVRARCLWDNNRNTAFWCCQPRSQVERVNGTIDRYPPRFEQVPYNQCKGISFLTEPTPEQKTALQQNNCFMRPFPAAGAFIGVPPSVPNLGIGDYGVCCNPQADDPANGPVNAGAAPNIRRCSFSIQQNINAFNAGTLTPGNGPIAKLYPVIAKTTRQFQPPNNAPPVTTEGSFLEIVPNVPGNGPGYHTDFIQYLIEYAPGIKVYLFPNGQKAGRSTVDPAKNAVRVYMPNPDALSHLMRMLSEPLPAPADLDAYNNDPRRLFELELDESTNPATWKAYMVSDAPMGPANPPPQLPAQSFSINEVKSTDLTSVAVRDRTTDEGGEYRRIAAFDDPRKQERLLQLLLYPRQSGELPDARTANSCVPAGRDPGQIATYQFDQPITANTDYEGIQNRVNDCSTKCGLVFCVYTQIGAAPVPVLAGAQPPAAPGAAPAAPAPVQSAQIIADCVRGGVTIPANVLTQAPGNRCFDTDNPAQVQGNTVKKLMPNYCSRPIGLDAPPAANAALQVRNQYIATLNAIQPPTKLWGVLKYEVPYQTLSECRASANPCVTFVPRVTGATSSGRGGSVPGGTPGGTPPGGGPAQEGGQPPGQGPAGIGGVPLGGNDGAQAGDPGAGEQGGDPAHPAGEDPGQPAQGNGGIPIPGASTAGRPAGRGSSSTAFGLVVPFSVSSPASSAGKSTSSDKFVVPLTLSSSSSKSASVSSTPSGFGVPITLSSSSTSKSFSSLPPSTSGVIPPLVFSSSRASTPSTSGVIPPLVFSSSRPSTPSTTPSTPGTGTSSRPTSPGGGTNPPSPSTPGGGTTPGTPTSPGTAGSKPPATGTTPGSPSTTGTTAGTTPGGPGGGQPGGGSATAGGTPGTTSGTSGGQPGTTGGSIPGTTGSTGGSTGTTGGTSNFFSSRSSVSSGTTSSVSLFSSSSFSSVCPPEICFPCVSNSQCPSNQCLNGTCVPLCGNGVVDASEICDDGNTNNEDSCSNSCKLNVTQTCRTHGQCQTGLCQNEHCASCNTNSQCPSDTLCLSRECVTAPVCGNGIKEWTEICDDGNRDDNDSCSNLCRKGSAESCSVNRDCASLFCFSGQCSSCTMNDQCGGASCTDGRCGDLCGNGTVDPGEQCDQNGQNSDVIASRCRSDCTNPRVGDGVKDPAEECDDRNTTSGDGCDRYGRLEAGSPGGPVAIDLSPNKTPLPGSVITNNNRPGSLSEEGPAAVAVMAAGGAAGWAWMRRRRK